MNIRFLNDISQNNKIKSSELSSWLLSHGITSITTEDIAVLLGVPKNQVPQRLVAPKKRNEIVLLSSGMWVPISPEYRTWGAPPAIEIVDDLMRHIKVDYYVGWLSAAALHGASHNAPQVFQVAVSRSIRTKTLGRSRIQFYHREHIGLVNSIKIETRSGFVSVSSRETTMLDIANNPDIVGGIDNVANLIIELCDTETPNVNELCLLSKHYPSSAIRRLGFILEQFTETSALEQLQLVCAQRNTPVSVLDPQKKGFGSLSKNWRLRINREIQPDI